MQIFIRYFVLLTKKVVDKKKQSNLYSTFYSPSSVDKSLNKEEIHALL